MTWRDVMNWRGIAPEASFNENMNYIAGVARSAGYEFVCVTDQIWFVPLEGPPIPTKLGVFDLNRGQS